MIEVCRAWQHVRLFIVFEHLALSLMDFHLTGKNTGYFTEFLLVLIISSNSTSKMSVELLLIFPVERGP